MKIRRLHKIIGLTLLLPFAGWILTALVFSIKPGYAAAYEYIQPKTSPLAGKVSIAADSTWLEIKYLRTVLGNHLLVHTSAGWKQLDPVTLRPREKPTKDEIRALLTDAFSANPSRYGEVAIISNDTIMTSTGIQVILDWDGLSLYQRGPDTDRIDMLYKIHYLQWTGVAAIDRILGPLVLTLVLTLCILGIRLATRSG